jgi:hypothetical protein
MAGEKYPIPFPAGWITCGEKEELVKSKPPDKASPLFPGIKIPAPHDALLSENYLTFAKYIPVMRKEAVGNISSGAERLFDAPAFRTSLS